LGLCCKNNTSVLSQAWPLSFQALHPLTRFPPNNEAENLTWLHAAWVWIGPMSSFVPKFLWEWGLHWEQASTCSLGFLMTESYLTPLLHPVSGLHSTGCLVFMRLMFISTLWSHNPNVSAKETEAQAG
jgi:hypothetical protein